MHGHKSTVQILLDRDNYKKDESDACGNTPLIESLRMGHLHIANLLISQHQADIYVQDKTGKTGFHIAAEAGQQNTLKTLIGQYGVSVDLLTETGKLLVMIFI